MDFFTFDGTPKILNRIKGKLLAQDKIIMGIDPGTMVMGYGILQVDNKKLINIALGSLQLNKLSNHQLKLKRIFERTLSLIDEFKPDEIAIEAPFYGKNVQSMLKLGRAQGVGMAAGLYRGIPLFEYSPKRIKQSITGNGNASKEQVAAMLKTILSLETLPKSLDASDGMAVALCHHFTGNSSVSTKSYSGWKGFIQSNPDKIR